LLVNPGSVFSTCWLRKGAGASYNPNVTEVLEYAKVQIPHYIIYNNGRTKSSLHRVTANILPVIKVSDLVQTDSHKSNNGFTIDPSNLVLRNPIHQTNALVQGWRMFLRARAQTVYKFRSSFQTVCSMSAVIIGYRVDVCRITNGAHIEHL